MSLAYAPMETAAVTQRSTPATPKPIRVEVTLSPADADAFAARQARLLTGNLTLLMALEANGLHRKADALLTQIAAGIDRRPPKLVTSLPTAELPEHERGRSADHVRRLDILNRRIAKPLPKGDKKAEKARADDLAERDALEALPSIKADQRWQRDALAETQALAAQRGEAITEDKAGVRRIMDRDPLLSLARSGRITVEQCDVGLAVRELYEMRRADAATAPFDGMPAGSHDHERFVANRWWRARSVLPAGQLENAIIIGHFRTRLGDLHFIGDWPERKAASTATPELALRVLRWVCDEGKTLTSMGEGRAYARNCEALIWALEIADFVLDTVARRPAKR